MRIHQENFTADDADALNGTQLNILEAPGQLDIFILSTQADTVLSITGPGTEPLAQSVEVPQETRAVRPNDDIPFTVPILETGHYTVNIDITTAATVQMVAIYRNVDELE